MTSSEKELLKKKLDRQHAKMKISEIEGIELIEFFELEQDSTIYEKFACYRNEWRRSDFKPTDKKSIYSPEDEIEDWIIQSVNILEGKEYFWINYGFVSKWCGKIRIVDPKRFVASQSSIFLMECYSGTIYDVACYSSDEYHYSLFVWGEITPFTNIIEEYLKEDTVINYKCELITQLSNQLFQKADNELEYIKIAYEYVRDNISHSADINEDLLTCTASEVLEAGHGICFAKSHLLAALLRAKSIPTGFCYQKLILDDETAPVLIYHGLNGVYISDMKKWVRLDARGNKEGVNAQFSLDTEQLAFPIRPELGEVDGFVVYPNPDVKVLERMRKYDTRSELWEDLPTELGYGVDKIIAACGNDCSMCPRYVTYPFEKTDEQLHCTAELWMKIGYRDHVVSNDEISCTGCKPENWCRYKVVKCCEDRGITNCGECTEYPCANMKECFEVTKSFEPQCRNVCTDEEYEQLKKAFFEKEKNLDCT